MQYEVGHQATNDVPSYIVKDVLGWSQILNCNWIFLIAPEVERGIPLCAGVCTT